MDLYACIVLHKSGYVARCKHIKNIFIKNNKDIPYGSMATVWEGT